VSRLLRNGCGLDLVLGIGSFHGPGGLSFKDALSLCRGCLVDDRSLRRQEWFFPGRILFQLLLNEAAKLHQKRGVLFVQELFTGSHFSHKFIAPIDADDLVDLDQMLAGVIAQFIILPVILKPT